MKRVYLPARVKDRKGNYVEQHLPEEKRAYFYINEVLEQNAPGKLLILMQEVGEKLKASEWNRGAEINHSVDKGSQRLLILRAIKSGFKVAVLNPNENTYYDPNDGQMHPILGSETVGKYVISAWDYLMNMGEYSLIAIVAHRNSCEILIQLQELRNIIQLVKQIVFIDSMYALTKYELPTEFQPITQRYELVCPLHDKNCKIVNTSQRELMPFLAMKEILEFLNIPTSRLRSASVKR